MTDGEHDAIVATALDYYEGWFDGEPDRMERALHPELAKRALTPERTIDNTTAEEMVEGTRAGMGKARKPAELKLQVDVDDVHGSIASARVTSNVYVDYLQLVKTDGRWQILNALWAHA